jgi:hypothetical protein
MTPRMVDMLLTRRRIEQENAEWSTGLIAAAIVNNSFNPPKTPVKPTDFMPSQQRHRKPATVIDSMDALFASMSAAAMTAPAHFKVIGEAP